MTEVMAKADQWNDCYSVPWKGLLVEDAFKHPAKCSKALADRIYEHAVERGWLKPGDVVLDPFGGIGGCALWPALHGVRWVGIELEPAFCTLAQANFALWKKRWRHDPDWVKPVIVQGDSRRLGELLVENAALIVSSPPYSETGVRGGVDTESALQRKSHLLEQAGYNSQKWLGNRRCTQMRNDGYGQSPGQLGALPAGEPPSLLVSSPPYSAGTVHSGGGIDLEKLTGNKPGPNTQAKARGYGVSEGQLGALPAGEPPSLLVSSPPYEASLSSCGDMNRREIVEEKAEGRSWGRNANDTASNDNYGITQGQLGNVQGDTFWKSARVILAQTFSVLRPGGHAIWICKRFVRRGAIVEFPQQWAALCESVGFKLVCWHHAMLVKKGQKQKMIDGGEEELSTSRKSFFRRLAERKGSPAIDWEDVICMEK